LKYLRNEDIIYWYRNGLSWPSQGSAIWRNFQKILLFFCRNIIWNLQNGNNILIGLDAIKGVDSNPKIGPQLLMCLHQRGIFFWAQVIKGWKNAIPMWKTNRDLDIEGVLAAQWNSVIWNMKNAGIYKTEFRDCIEWQTKKGSPNILVRDIFLSLLEQQRESSWNFFPFSLWKSSYPIKIILFSWLIYHNKNLTWNNSQKRNWQGPSICLICLADSEDNLHMFLLCPHTELIWRKLASVFGFPGVSHPSIKEAFVWWGALRPDSWPIPMITIWFIWKWENKKIFQNSNEVFGSIMDKIIPYYFSFLQIMPQKKNHQVASSALLPLSFPRAHFDGATKDGICACGVFIAISKDLNFSIF